MHALLAAAAEHGEEVSKVPFYVAGCALAAWAVILSAVGLTRPNFPGSAAVARGTGALTVLLVVAAAYTAIITG